MAKLFIEESTLTAIGDAIREKKETTELLNPSAMPDEIRSIQSGGGKVVLSGDISKAFSADSSSTGMYYNFGKDVRKSFISQGMFNCIETKDVTNLLNTFRYIGSSYGFNEPIDLPFDINIAEGTEADVTQMCGSSSAIRSIGNINGQVSSVNGMFYGCSYLEDLSHVTGIKPQTSNTGLKANAGSCFYQCNRLRRISPELHKVIGSTYTSSSSYKTDYYQAYYGCCVLDEIIGLGTSAGEYLTNGVPYITGNQFSYTFSNCYRLKRMLFETNEDGTPKVVDWRSQTIDFSSNTGWCSTTAGVSNYGFTTDTKVTDDATYQALKDNPDYWTSSASYSRYNRASAVETINSLPDTSAYLSKNSTWKNNIKFKGTAGELTDAGAINTMTSEEIAVATAKGWTVSFA